MGLDYHIYIGPFVKIFNPKKPSFTEQNGCDNNKCSEYHKLAYSKFCAYCGTPISKIQIPALKEQKFDFYGELKEALVPSIYYKPKEYADFEFLIANHDFNIGREYFIDAASHSTILGMSPEKMTWELSQFTSKFEKELNVLRVAFGTENVEMAWGVINWAS